MAKEMYKYVIVGGGLAGISAAKGIRTIDAEGSILLIGAEKHLPYHRPPLTKSLWSKTKSIDDIFVEDFSFYGDKQVATKLGVTITQCDAQNKTISDSSGNQVGYEKLLLATGGIPKKLSIPGGDDPEICYYRYLDDYKRIRDLAKEGTRVVVIGGGFIGSEIAASLSQQNLAVTMVFPEDYMCGRVFPESLGTTVLRKYQENGIRIDAGDIPTAIERKDKLFITTTKKGKRYESEIVIAGIGITPAIAIAENAGLALENGIIVNGYFQTSNPDIYAVGDNTNFHYPALNSRRRIEHWDAAMTQGEHAGKNMAGSKEPFTYLPYFFSDLFDFGYEAVGETDPSLETVSDWQKENQIGIIYYLKDNRVRGAMMCNVWNKLDAARELIESHQEMTEPQLQEAIK
ncbi:MAG: NAD(P)/FAD-dependent oxidoreductase [Chitinivibrionales bacterium]|nr:NAD(P)/FAD-dependent oxidoreductase [Chitinivibrionales bacterium]